MSKETKKYRKTLESIFDQIDANNEESIVKAAGWMADAIERDELIHVVGSGGHSNMGAEEMLWRAGGLAPIDAMLDAGTNLIHGAKRSNIIERLPGYGVKIFDLYPCKTGEVIIIVNAYGINSMTIDMCEEAHRRGMKVIAITSKSFCQNVPKDAPSRHPSGKNLFEIADVFVDCCLPMGDAVIDIEGLDQRVGATSTFCNAYCIQCLVIETCRILAERGKDVPVWCSANAPGGDQKNKAMEEKYFPRVKHLR